MRSRHGRSPAKGADHGLGTRELPGHGEGVLRPPAFQERLGEVQHGVDVGPVIAVEPEQCIVRILLDLPAEPFDILGLGAVVAVFLSRLALSQDGHGPVDPGDGATLDKPLANPDRYQGSLKSRAILLFEGFGCPA